MKKIICLAAVAALAFCAGGACFAAEAVRADFSLVSEKALDFDALKKFKLPIIADYGSEGCPPCRKMAPALEKTNKKYRGRAIIKFMDVWKHRASAGDMPLSVIPTQFFFTAEGKPFVPSEKLANRLKFLFYDDEKTKKHSLTAHRGALTEADFDEILKEMGVR